MATKVIVAGLGPRGLDWAREVGSGPGYELAACVDVSALTPPSRANLDTCPANSRMPLICFSTSAGASG